ncbi:MAG: nicotinate (nicotinamide) nucleotide adenylyltransferase [Planctomycetota bacterium]
MPDPASPDLTPYRRLLIFGGSFDPPHMAHVDLPRRVAEVIGADVVAYIPAGKAPHKLDKQQTDPIHRLAMLRLALAEEEHAVVLTDELDRVADGRPSYTVDTLEALNQRLHPEAEMRLLIGTDQVAIFEKWYRWERVIELAEPVVMMRPPETADNLPASWQSRVVEVSITDVSSTAVRERVAARQSLDGWVHPAVADYIRTHGLYRS